MAPNSGNRRRPDELGFAFLAYTEDEREGKVAEGIEERKGNVVSFSRLGRQAGHGHALISPARRTSPTGKG